jgi:hypothetical protein
MITFGRTDQLRARVAHLEYFVAREQGRAQIEAASAKWWMEEAYKVLQAAAGVPEERWIKPSDGIKRPNWPVEPNGLKPQ